MYDKKKGYDPDKDYSAAMLDPNLSAVARTQLENERNAKIKDMYGGVEPTLNGSSQTYTEMYGPRNADNTDNLNYYQRLLASGNEKPTYSSQWDETVSNLAKQALGMNYGNWTQGADYASLAKRYTQAGSQAMRDTLAQIAARTGGLASSYATAAAAQQYNNYMNQLEVAARNMYDADRNAALQKVNLAKGMADSDYGKYTDALNQYNNERNYDMSALNVALSANNAERSYALSRDQFDYSKAQDEKNLQLTLAQLAAGAGNFDRFKDFGMTDAEISALKKAYNSKPSGGSASQYKTVLSTAKNLLGEKSMAEYADLYNYMNRAIDSGAVTEEEAANILTVELGVDPDRMGRSVADYNEWKRKTLNAGKGSTH